MAQSVEEARAEFAKKQAAAARKVELDRREASRKTQEAAAKTAHRPLVTSA